MCYILYCHLYFLFTFRWAQYKLSNLVNPLDCQQKIDMGLVNEKQFGLLGDNGNSNRFKT